MSRNFAPSQTPHDKTSQDARSKRERDEASLLDQQLDKELDDSFPASDPPSLTQDQR